MNFSELARKVYNFSASSGATIASVAIILLWAVTGPLFHFSDTWQLVINTGTTIVTFVMVFVLNNAQARDTAAINAKLDALILANKDVDNKLISIEDDSDGTVIAVRQVIKNAANAD